MSAIAPRPAPRSFDPAAQAAAEAMFRAAHPAFGTTGILDELRRTEYGRLDARGDVYLDYTGGSLYAATQLEQHLRVLRHGVYGNPHSGNPTLVGVDRARGPGPVPPCCAGSTLRRGSTSASSRRTRRARCDSSARRIRSGRTTGSWRRATTTIRSTASASSRGRRERARPTCRWMHRTFASPTGRSSATSTTVSRTDTTSSPIRPSPTSRASNIRSSGPNRPRSGAGTYFWTAPRSHPRARST